MTWEYSEDILIEQTAIDLFHNQLGWDTAIAYNKETFGEGSTLGRLNKKEVVLKKIFFENIKEFNPGLTQKAYVEAYEKLTEESITKSLAEINFEQHQLLRNGIPVDFINEKGEQVKNKTLFEVLPYPTYQTDDIDLRTNLVYEHLKHQYFGGGMSIYGRY